MPLRPGCLSTASQQRDLRREEGVEGDPVCARAGADMPGRDRSVPRSQQCASFAALALVWLVALISTVSADYLGISAQPSYRMLGRLGHELLTKTEHSCAARSCVVYTTQPPACLPRLKATSHASLTRDIYSLLRVIKPGERLCLAVDVNCSSAVSWVVSRHSWPRLLHMTHGLAGTRVRAATWTRTPAPGRTQSRYVVS